jgi:iron-sulfur cluster assembly accessory protein
MDHIRMLRKMKKDEGEELVLRMGVKSGGCSGLSYVMDLETAENVTEDDMVEVFGEGDNSVRCVIDPKSVLYLYGMTLDYSDELIGGGFQFQ